MKCTHCDDKEIPKGRNSKFCSYACANKHIALKSQRKQKALRKADRDKRIKELESKPNLTYIEQKELDKCKNVPHSREIRKQMLTPNLWKDL